MWLTTPRADPGARAARLVIIAATVVFALIVCRWRPWDLFDRGGFSTDFYDEQARSFLRFRLAVRPEVPGPEGFLIDSKTYLYYGPFLALVRMPFAVFGDVFAGRLTRVSMIVGYAVFCTASYHLVVQARQWLATHRSDTTPASAPSPSPWRTAGFVAAAACSPVLFLAGWVSVYHETELWAAAFAIWAVVGVMRLLHTPTRRDAWLTAAAIAAAILTRAPVGIGVAAGAGVLALLPPLRMWSRSPGAVAGRLLVGGAVVGFTGHVLVNWLKFATALGLPAERQLLSITDPTRAAWFAGNNGSFFSMRFLPTTVVHYLRPDTVSFERLFPFVRYGQLATDRGSYPLETITASASITATATLLFGAAIIGLVVAVRVRAWPWLITFGGACLAAGPTFTIGFIGNRYLVDMLPMLMIPAALAFAALPVSSPALVRAARAAVVALVVWGAWSNVALAMWTQNLKEPGFTEWRYRVDDWMFGDPAPALVALDPSQPVARDGVVAVVVDRDTGRCDAVYIAEQATWVALERNPGPRALRGTIDLAQGSTALAGGDTWTVSAVRDGNDVRVEFDEGTGVQAGAALVIDAGATDVRIVADETTGEFSLTLDGQLALFRFSAPPSPMLAFDGFTAIEPAPDGGTLCHRLDARR